MSPRPSTNTRPIHRSKECSQASPTGSAAPSSPRQAQSWTRGISNHLLGLAALYSRANPAEFLRRKPAIPSSWGVILARSLASYPSLSSLLNSASGPIADIRFIGSALRRIQVAISFTSTLPLVFAISRHLSTASLRATRNTQLLSVKNTSVAVSARRLFPSTSGWFLIMERRRTAALSGMYR